MRNDCNPLERQELLSQMRELYKAARWELPEDFLERSHYERVVREKINWQSSPGYPYLLTAPTNERFFEVVDGEPGPAALGRVWQLVQARIAAPEADPIRLFIKPEPHKKKKLQQGAYRLISSVSVVDQIIDQMLFAPMNDRLVAEVLQVPSKAGWSPYGGGWKIFPRGWVSMDKTAWDWSAQPWIFQQLLEVRKALCDSKSDPRWPKWGNWLHVDMVFSTGTPCL